MYITYVSHARFPTEKAHGKQIAEVCSAISALGHDIDLVCPTIRNNIHISAHEYYGLPVTFSIKYLHNFDATAHWWVPGILRFGLTMLCYRRALKHYFTSHASDLVYVRSPLLLSPLLAARVPVVLELHSIPKRARSILVKQCMQCKLVVCLTSLMADELVELGVDRNRIAVEGDGVDLSRFTQLPSSDEIRSSYDLPKKRKLVGYVGSLVTQNTIEKGVGELIDALSILKEYGEESFGWIVGGPKSWQKKYQKHAHDIGLTGLDIRFQERIPVPDVAAALSACDVLVYPAPTSSHPFFLRYTSPLKIFEYMAADKIIVSADIPPIREIADETAVIFCKPGNAQSLADALQAALDSDPSAQSKARLSIAQHYSWEKRMQRILDSATL
ncbi:MAG: glycosyltransferase family 4 protein [bacterium]|nr:glycosyltransferase family 4 protein [bacterium]